jgi:DNA-binding GntR family transcriptional regulator
VSLKEIKEIYDTRFLLEVSLVPEIIKSVDDTALQQIETSLAAYHSAVDEENYYNRLMTDMNFHLSLASISNCRIQLKMLQELFDMLLLKYTRNLVLLGIMDSSLKEHDEILSSVKIGDPERLRQALSSHLDHVRTQIVAGFKKMFVSRKESNLELITFQ